MRSKRQALGHLPPPLSFSPHRDVLPRRRFGICHAGSREGRSRRRLGPRSEAGRRRNPAAGTERVIRAREERGEDVAGEVGAKGGREGGRDVVTDRVSRLAPRETRRNERRGFVFVCLTYLWCWQTADEGADDDDADDDDDNAAAAV